VLFLFFLKNFYTTTWNCQIPRFLTERLNIFFLYVFFFHLAAKELNILCCCFFGLSYHRLKKKPIPRLSSPNDAVCVSPRLFNVFLFFFPPPFGIVYIFWFYVERLVVAVQVLKAFSIERFVSRIEEEEMWALSNFLWKKKGGGRLGGNRMEKNNIKDVETERGERRADSLSASHRRSVHQHTVWGNWSFNGADDWSSAGWIEP
jgi:hypothetical protein